MTGRHLTVLEPGRKRPRALAARLWPVAAAALIALAVVAGRVLLEL